VARLGVSRHWVRHLAAAGCPTPSLCASTPNVGRLTERYPKLLRYESKGWLTVWPTADDPHGPRRLHSLPLNRVGWIRGLFQRGDEARSAHRPERRCHRG
jgi:hypothetical protein